MNYELMAVEILMAVGGKGNVSSATHCVTRLRLNVVNRDEIDVEKAKNISGVMGVSDKGGQFQFIIGPSVDRLYKEFKKLIELTNSVETVVTNEEGGSGKKGIKDYVNAVFDVLSGTFVMFIPALIAAGMISAVLALLTSFNVVSAEDPTYIVFSAIQSAIFYYLPVFAGYGAASKMKMNPFIGMALGVILCSSAINGVEGLSIFGLSIPTVTYNSTVFPVLLGVCLMAYVEKGMKKITPEIIKGLLVPMVTLLAGVIATLFLLGPIGSHLGKYLAAFITFISDKAGWLAPAVIALMKSITVLTGMHYSLIPIAMNSFASLGYDNLIMVGGFIGNIVQAGAAAGFALSETDKNKKANALSMAFSALCGIAEPALFGVTLRNKKILISSMIGGFCGGLFAGITSSKAFGFVGGLPSLPLFIGPSGGFSNLIFVIISIIIGFTVTFGLTIILNRRGKKNE